MAEVFFHPAAEGDYAAALAWYQERSARAAAGFVAEMERAIEFIATFPDLSPSCDERHRYLLLRRYPYSVVYRVDGEYITVVAVAHSRRAVAYWKGRS